MGISIDELIEELAALEYNFEFGWDSVPPYKKLLDDNSIKISCRKRAARILELLIEHGVIGGGGING